VELTPDLGVASADLTPVGFAPNAYDITSNLISHSMITGAKKLIVILPQTVKEEKNPTSLILF